MSENPTFVFVNGAWHSPDSFDTIRARLAQDDYPSAACRLPSIGTHPTVDSMEPDVASVRETVAALLGEGKSVICVAHSYGGTVLTEAIGTLAQRSGLVGKNDARVRRLVYVSAAVPRLGETQMDVGKGAPSEPPPVYHRLVSFQTVFILSFSLLDFT
jgi:pimeloyl-ACP methyl ester carboxylesterase